MSPLAAASLFFAGTALGVLAALHGLYFYRQHQSKLDKDLMGDQYFDGGFLYSWMQRTALYGTACIFPGFARFIPNIDRVRLQSIDRSVRRHLIANVVAVDVAIVLMLGGGIAMGP